MRRDKSGTGLRDKYSRRLPYRAVVEAMEDRVLLATLTVNDTADANVRDGVLTLREAILVANGALAVGSLAPGEQAQVAGILTSPAPDTIAFNIPGAGPHTISLVSDLPTITDPVVIDGYTQPGATPNTLAVGDDAVLRIELTRPVNSTAISSTAISGLTLTSGGSTVRGLVINRFTNGILIANGTGNRVLGNFIGTDVTGTVALANATGVFINSASNNTIGGATAGERNVISGNDGNGVYIDYNATGNRVVGNFIGTDVTGNVALANGTGVLSGAGVYIGSASNNTIGGATAGERNVISGNDTAGVAIADTPGVVIVTDTGNRVVGNFIGTDVTGTFAVANGTVGRDRSSGVFLNSSSNNTIGGATAGERNVISGNDGNGVYIEFSSTRNVVQGNFIGTDVTGTVALGNTTNGVSFSNSASNNTIGGATAGEGNTISFNGGAGVNVFSGNSNALLSNSIFSNVRLGIDLGGDGVTTNDPLDVDAGANNLQNFPVLTAATTSAGTTNIQGILNSTPNSSFRIEFFASVAADPSGFGEGQTFLGATTVTTDGGGNARFSSTLAVGLPPGRFITATATFSAPRNTSEFSRAVLVSDVLNPVIPDPPPRSDDDLFIIDLEPADPTLLRVRRNDEAPIRISLIAQAGVTIDGGRGNDRFVINLTGRPNLVPGRSFTLIVSGGTGSDQMNLLGLPAVPGIDLVLDGETTDFDAPSVGANPGDVLDLSRLPNSAQIVAYNDFRRAGAIRLDYRDGPSVTGFSLRNFGSTTGLASDRSVELVGDFGAGTAFGVGIPQSDRITVRATGFREFTARLNDADPLRFTAPRLALRGKSLSDTFELSPLSGNAWGVEVDVEGSDPGDMSAVGPAPGAGDILRLNDPDPESNEISVVLGAPARGRAEDFSFHRIDTISVRPSEAAGGVDNTLTFTDSSPGNTLNVFLGASGLADESVYDPLLVVTGPNVEARHGLALATSTGNDDLQLVLKGGGHVVNVLLLDAPRRMGRNLSVTGERSDRLNVIVSGNAQVSQFTRVVRFQNPSVRRRFSFVRVRYPGPDGATYLISSTNVSLGPLIQRPGGAVGGRANRSIRGEGLPKGPLSIAGLRNRPMTR